MAPTIDGSFLQVILLILALLVGIPRFLLDLDRRFDAQVLWSLLPPFVMAVFAFISAPMSSAISFSLASAALLYLALFLGGIWFEEQRLHRKATQAIRKGLAEPNREPRPQPGRLQTIRGTWLFLPPSVLALVALGVLRNNVLGAVLLAFVAGLYLSVVMSDDFLKKRLTQRASDAIRAGLAGFVPGASEHLESGRSQPMQSLIGAAIEHGRESALQKSEIFGEPKIFIVGCGGAGSKTVNRLHRLRVRGAVTYAIDTDKQTLDPIEADAKLLIGKTTTRGLGSGGDPEVAERSAEIARDKIEEMLMEPNLVFITAGMGGGTGTGIAPLVADVARRLGAIVIGIVSSPFSVERARIIRGDEGLQKLRKSSHMVVALDNNRLLGMVPNLPIDQAFSVMDELIAEAIKGISETITQPSLINLDFADVKAIMGEGGLAVMLWGEAKVSDGASAVVSEALNHPLLDVDYRGATGALIHITGGPDLALKYAEEVAEGLTYELDAHANVIWGARMAPQLEGRCRVIAILTGIRS